MKSAIAYASPIILFVLVACGGSTPPPAEQPKAPAPVVAPPEPEPVAEEKAEPKEEPKEEPKRPAGPMATYNNPAEAVTIGLDGAVIRLGAAELRIPSGAFSAPHNVLFTLDARYRGTKGKVGDVYRIEVQVPNQSYRMGDARPSQPLPTRGDSFVIKLPLPAGKDSANLAVENTAVDDKGRATSTWTIRAMTKVETSDDGGKAIIETSELPDGHIHLTTEAAGQ
jgi:hypothetical protein